MSHVLRQDAHNGDIIEGGKGWPQGETVKQSNTHFTSVVYVYQSLMTWLREAKRKPALARAGSFSYV